MFNVGTKIFLITGEKNLENYVSTQNWFNKCITNKFKYWDNLLGYHRKFVMINFNYSLHILIYVVTKEIHYY